MKCFEMLYECILLDGRNCIRLYTPIYWFVNLIYENEFWNSFMIDWKSVLMVLCSCHYDPIEGVVSVYTVLWLSYLDRTIGWYRWRLIPRRILVDLGYSLILSTWLTNELDHRYLLWYYWLNGHLWYVLSFIELV